MGSQIVGFFICHDYVPRDASGRRLNFWCGLTWSTAKLSIHLNVWAHMEALERLNRLDQVHCVIFFPSLSVNAPTIIIMRSIRVHKPRPPKVTNCNMPVPIFPT